VSAPVPEPVPIPVTADRQPLRLLAVEDSMRDARLLRELLRDSGAPLDMTHVQTLEAASGELARRRFDCVLLDLGLPDGDGVENVERIRRCDREVAIVVLTGRDDQQYALQALRRGAQDYAVKGEHDGEALLRIVHHAIERNRLLAQLDNEREQEYFRASHDALTGLPNRQLFLDRAQVALTQADRAGAKLAICFIDLDGFKSVNDTAGHAIGDALLRQVALMLLDCVREGDTVARVGGDEFVILLTSAADRDGAELVGHRIIERVRSIKHVEGAPVVIGASAGIALFPEHAPTLQQLLVHADSAMYQAKRAGKNTLRMYQTPTLATASADPAVLNENLLSLCFQPWVNARNGTCAGLEAFVRSTDGSDGAGEILRQARQNAWLDALGRWVLQQACREWQTLRDRGLEPPRISINVSAAELDGREFAASRLAIIEQFGLPRGVILLEIPESALDGDGDAGSRLAQLRVLDQNGAGIVLDNFGRHDASLRRLERLPLTAVKLDPSVLREQRDGGHVASVIVNSTISIARSLGREAIVTGVESAADHEAAMGLGAIYEQGLWLAGPVFAEGVPKMLARRQSVHDAA
jgi:diguanylate cyclase (GGDEF)-like protein